MNNSCLDSQNKTRNAAIDILKCFAAILITNSHMAGLYPDPYSSLATGGAIGDALFFFASGFTISYSRGGNFGNWYKRRVNRIFPTIFAVAAIDIILFGKDPTLKEIVTNCGGWFIQCIFLFYAVFWFVKKYLMNRLWVSYAINTAIVLVWYFAFWDHSTFIFYNGTYLRWALYFFAMLMGASVAKHEKTHDKKKYPVVLSLIILVLLLGLYYGYQIIGKRYTVLNYGQLILAPALYAIVFCFYKICDSKAFLNFYSKRIAHNLIYWISALCLEVYLCQHWILPTGAEFIHLFPANVFLSFVAIGFAAYILKVASNFLSQTFRTDDYDWKKMVSL